MTKLIALTPINHDGKEFAEGDTLDVTDKAQVAQLVDSGAASIKGQKSKVEAAADAAAAAQAAADAADAQAVLDAATDQQGQ
jgi:peptide subunit release factor 1 (eRF1)